MWRIIAITPEYPSNEAKRIPKLLEGDVDIVHLRKPRGSAAQIRSILDAIPEKYYNRIALHDHFSLAREYGLGGIHLNYRNPEPPPDFSGRISASCHNLSELRAKLSQCDYIFLSPIFNSISKQDHKSSFTVKKLANAKEIGLINSKVIALGGIKKEHFPFLKQYGFGGAAMTGSIWESLPEFQFITHKTSRYGYAESANLALNSGFRWIQLRMKDEPLDLIKTEALKVQSLCKTYGATFIIDDHVELAREINADGVHLGANDMPIAQARAILHNRIIGGTANTMDDIRRLFTNGADYLGVGPFRYTNTKKNPSPILGIEGYKRMLQQCKQENIHIPIYAIGGITAEDLPHLKAAGIYGVAVSSGILQATDPIAAGTEFISTWK